MAIRVLVVDDEVYIRNAYERIFKSRGLDVFTAADASEARNVLLSRDIDVAFVDINMSEVDGPTLYEVIKMFHSRVKIVISSVYPIDEQMELVSGADAYYDKSDGKDGLLCALAEAFKSGGRPPVPVPVSYF